MMKFFSLCILLLLTPASIEAGEERLSELDKEIVRFFRQGDIGSETAIGPPEYPDKAAYFKKLEWYWNQGQNARPALMHLLTEVYEGDFPNMSRAINALCAMNGDRSDILAYVRERLPKINNATREQGGHAYIQASLRVLGQFGTAEDMELIRSFLNHPDVVVRSTAMTQERNLQARIDAGEFDKSETRRNPDSNVREEKKEGSSGNQSDNHGKSGGKRGNDPGKGWVLIVLAGLITAALFVWRKSRRHHALRGE